MTNEDGFFQVNVLAMKYIHLTLTPPSNGKLSSYIITSIPDELITGDSLDNVYVIKSSNTISGIVSFSDGSLPPPDTTIYFYDSNNCNNKFIANIDLDGKYSINVSPGQYSVFVSFTAPSGFVVYYNLPYKVQESLEVNDDQVINYVVQLYLWKITVMNEDAKNVPNIIVTGKSSYTDGCVYTSVAFKLTTDKKGQCQMYVTPSLYSAITLYPQSDYIGYETTTVPNQLISSDSIDNYYIIASS